MILDFSTVETPVNISTDFILSKISDAQIFRHYFGEFEPYKGVYKSVFRRDRTPSTGFYYGETGKLRYKDFGTGESWDCFGFVAKVYNLTFKEAIRKIACDFGLIKCGTAPLPASVIKTTEKYERKTKPHTEIQIVAGKWNKERLDYWKQYEITRKELDFYHIYPVDQLFINKQYIGNRNNEMRFAYLLKTPKKEYMKIYTPYATDRWKWVTNIPLNIPFGWDSLSRGSETVFLTKSLKDMIVLRKIFPSVLATQNESESALNDKLLNYLKKDFKKIVIFWDNDEVGKENCKKFNEKGCDYFNIPNNYLYEGVKDPADFVRSYGLEKLKQLFKQKNLKPNEQ